MDTATLTDVALLFTDMEGSTRLLQRLGGDYPRVLEVHFGLLATAVSDAGGRIANRMGDGLLAIFPEAPGAFAAAVAAQRAIAAHDWPAAGIVRVRMGVHRGAVQEMATGHVGLDVHRAARICSAAHGGQILASADAASASALGTEGGNTFSLIDVGRHFLKDIEKAEHLFQVIVPGLLREFPPPRSRLARPHNLPGEVTEFVGRRSDIDAIERLLISARLLTLTGPGGCGKSRLALRVAGRCLAEFDDGVFFVGLAAITDPDQAVWEIARTVGAGQDGSGATLAQLEEHLGRRKLLLVLDNLEQVLGTAGAISRLLAAAPDLRIIVTSRALLRVAGEQVYEIMPMSIPRPDDAGDPACLAASDAVQLFVRRARAVRPDFELTDDNAGAVARIVIRLEGLPLAIELAAARVRLFPPEVMARRLDRPLKVLSGGTVRAEGHHGTLRDAIAWSYGLLDPAERAAFRRLGVFRGGFTLEAAETIAAGAPVADVLETVSSLLDKSLLGNRALLGEARMTMLEMIRDFALDELAATEELAFVRARHAGLFLELAEEMEPYLTGPAEVATIDRLAAEHANVQAALEYFREAGDVDRGLRVAASIWRFWHATGQSELGRDCLQALLEAPARGSTARTKGLMALGGLAYWQADYDAALVAYREALDATRAAGDRRNEAEALFALSTTLTWRGDAGQGGHLADKALDLFRAIGARDKVGMVLMAQGFARWMQGDLEAARPLWEQSQAIAREVGDRVEVATKSLALASLSWRQGHEREALARSRQALDELVELKNVSRTVMALDWIAAFATSGETERGLRLAGAAEALRRRFGGGMRPESSGLESARSVAARRLGPEAVEAAFDTGRGMKLDEAVGLARELSGLRRVPHESSTGSSGGWERR